MSTPNTNPYAAGAPAPGGGPGAGTPPAGGPGAPATLPTAPPAAVPPAAPATAPAAPAEPGVSLPGTQPAALDLENKPAQEPEQGNEVVYTYQPTGDASYDLALGFVGGLGIGPEDADLQAAFNGDFSKLETRLKAMGAKAAGYQGYMAAAKQAVERSSAKGAETVAAVQAAVGGAEAWGKVQALFKAEASSDEKAYINKAFALGGPVAVKVAQEMLAAYEAKNGTMGKPASGLSDNASAGETGAAGGPLDAAGFRKELSAMVAKYGAQGYQNRPEYAALVARRAR